MNLSHCFSHTQLRSQDSKFISISCIVTDNAQWTSNTKTKKSRARERETKNMPHWIVQGKKTTDRFCVYWPYWIICASWWKIVCWPKANIWRLKDGSSHIHALHELVSGGRLDQNYFRPLWLSIRVHLIERFAVGHFNYFE